MSRQSHLVTEWIGSRLGNLDPLELTRPVSRSSKPARYERPKDPVHEEWFDTIPSELESLLTFDGKAPR